MNVDQPQTEVHPKKLPLLTTSASRAFRACGRLFHLSYELGYRATSIDPNRTFGTLGHHGLEAWWTSAKDYPNNQEAWLDAALSSVSQETEDPFAQAKAEAMMLGYHSRWADVKMRVLAVEVEFQGPLVNPATGAESRTWRRGGKVDAIADLFDGSTWRTKVVEHKSSSEDIGPGSDYWMRLTLDPQISNYLHGARLLGFNVESCLYDVLLKPSQKPLLATPEESRRYTKKTGELDKRQRERDETPEEYKSRLVDVIAENPDRFYRRGEIVRLEQEEYEAALDLWQTGVQIREARRMGLWVRNPDACKRYGRSCDFLPVCVNEATVDDGTRYRKTERLNEELSGS